MKTIIKYYAFLIIFGFIYSIDAAFVDADDKISLSNKKRFEHDDFLPSDELSYEYFQPRLFYSQQDGNKKAYRKNDGIKSFSMTIIHDDIESIDELLNEWRISQDNSIYHDDIFIFGRNDVGQTLYHIAVIDNNLELLDYLFSNQIYAYNDPRLKDFYGRIPAYYITSKEMIAYLIDMNAIGMTGDEIMDLNIARDNENKTILHALIERGASLDIIQYIFHFHLIDRNLIDALDRYGKTALDYADDEEYKNELYELFD